MQEQQLVWEGDNTNVYRRPKLAVLKAVLAWILLKKTPTCTRHPKNTWYVIKFIIPALARSEEAALIRTIIGEHDSDHYSS